jgi:hypothetical protein
MTPSRNRNQIKRLAEVCRKPAWIATMPAAAASRTDQRVFAVPLRVWGDPFDAVGWRADELTSGSRYDGLA